MISTDPKSIIYNHSITDIDNENSLDFSFQVDTEFLKNKKIKRPRESSFMIKAVNLTFLNLSSLITNPNCMAYRIVDKATGFEYERLEIPSIISYETEELSGKKLYALIHYFNYDNIEAPFFEDTVKGSTNLHNHLLPIGVLPFHEKGLIGEIAYEMPIERHFEDCFGLLRSFDFARFGIPYALENPFLDFHKVVSSRTHLSLVVTQINGIKNSRKSNTEIIKNESRADELKEKALIAHSVTKALIFNRLF